MFKISFIPASNFRGSRVRIEDMWNKQKVIHSYNHDYRDMETQARHFLGSKGIEISADSADRKHNQYLLAENFDIPIK